MNQFFFWKNWPGAQRIVYQLLLLAFIVILIFFGFCYLKGAEAVIHWDTISISNKLSQPIHSFNLGLFNLSYNGDYFLIDEHYSGSDLQINTLAAYLFITIMVLALAVLLSVITFLSRLWYYLGILVVIGFLVACQFEQLLLFNKGDSLALIIAFVLILGPVYYFNSFNNKAPFHLRFFSFLGSFAVFGLIVGLFHGVANPALVLVNYSIAAPIVLSILFIILVSHNLILFFLQIVTDGSSLTSKNSLIHFSIITVIYLVNVLFIYLKNTLVVDWDLIYVNAFMLLAFSAIAGIWNFKIQEEIYGNILPFRPLAAYMYLALGLITFSTISYFMATANDPVLETIEDGIVYTHLIFGFLFFLYVLVNFYIFLINNKQVYRIVYRPSNFPYATYQIAGFIGIIALFLKANMFPFYQAVAGYYNGIGDIYVENKELFTAEQYYKLSNQYEFQNHRSNYALGSLARQQKDEGLTAFYFQQALLKSPTPFAYVNLSQAYQKNGRFFDALFNLKEGLKQFPDNQHIQNNLALLYAKTSILDSAIYLFDQAKTSGSTNLTAETNLLAFSTRHALEFKVNPDSAVDELLVHNDYLPAKANALALLCQQPEQKPIRLPTAFDKPEFPQDSIIENFGFTYLNNYLINGIAPPDTSLINQTTLLANSPNNFSYAENLQLSKAIALYQDQRVSEAFLIVDQLQAASLLRTGYYNNLLGTWALEQNAPLIAEKFFQKAYNNGFSDSWVNLAIAQTEGIYRDPARLDEARETWEAIMKSDSSETAPYFKLADTMLKILTVSQVQKVLPYNDAFKYQLLRYRAFDFSLADMEEIITSVQDISYKAMTLLDVQERFPEKAGIAASFTGIFQDNALSTYVKNRLQWKAVAAAASNQKYEELKASVGNLEVNTYQHKNEKLLATAIMANQEKNQKDAEIKFTRLLDNPFFAEGFVAAVNFFATQENETGYLYDKLLNAININPNSPALLKKYILMAISFGLENYAKDALTELKDLVGPTEFGNFEKVYQTKLKESATF